MLEVDDKVIVALDCGEDEALRLADALAGHAGWVKVGMTLYYACGPAIVSAMRERCLKVFLDLKLHDIPHQIRGAAQAAATAGADLISVHALGGADMMAAAREGVEAAAAATGRERAHIVGITILTSHDAASVASLGITDPIPSEVRRLALLATSSGADGIVCSPQEAADMRAALGAEPLIVTPGVRPAGADIGDQSRIATPASAIQAGASMLVVGRPITQADDPTAAFDAISAQVRGAN